MQQLITAGRVLTGPRDADPIPDGAVLVDGDTILAAGNRADIAPHVSDDAQHRDYPQGTVLPGLINAHVHLAFDGSADPVGHLREATDTDLLLGMAGRAQQHLSAGITTIRDLGDRDGQIVRLRASIERDELAGPRILAAGPPLTPPGGHCWFLGGIVSGPDEIRARIQRNADLGANVIKVMGTGGNSTPEGPSMLDAQFSPEELRLIVAEASTYGLPVAIHAYTADVIAAAVEAGVSTVEHANFLDEQSRPDLRDEVARTMAERGIAASPALPSGWRGMWDLLGAERAQSIADRLRWLIEHGVTVVTGSDAGVPISQHGDLISTLECYAHIGVPPASLIAMATSTTAQALGLGDTTGRLQAGQSADVLVVDGDPLQDLTSLRHPRLVVSRGRIQHSANQE